MESAGFNVKKRVSKLLASAKARGIRVDMDLNKYQCLINLGCHYCGDNLHKENGYCLDRVDPTKPYTITNVVACCKRCNMAKSNMTVDEFIDWINKVYKFTTGVIEYMKNSEIDYRKYDEQEVLGEMIKDLPKERIYYNPYNGSRVKK